MKLLKLIHLLLVAGIFMSSCNAPYQPVNNENFKERRGISNFFYKLENQDTVKVAYLGGSITAQAGWRVYSREWLSEQYPETVIEEIHAAIGGTGSPFGVYRLQDHVLKYDPDLVFVEFAVNDGSTSPEVITQSMEGIVQQIWQQNPEIDICYIYTIKSDFIEKYNHDSLPTSVETMEKIADHYQIPSINFGPEVLRRVKAGTLLFKGDDVAKDTITVFSPDNVHPYPDSGHKVYHDVFMNSFNIMKEKPTDKLVSHQMKEPLNPNPRVNATMINWTEIDNTGLLTSVDIIDHPTFKGFTRFFESIGEGNPGDSVSFRFEGQALGFYDVIGPGSGTISVNIDGEDHFYERFDKYCTYWRISYKTIDGLKDTVHQVTIKVLDQPIDKKAILAQRDNVMKNEEDFETLNWYVARIMLDGKLIVE